MKYFFFAMIFMPLMLLAQSRQMLPLDLRHQLKSFDPQTQVDVYLRGDVAAISTFVRTNNGTVKKRLANILSCSLPASAFSELNNLQGLEFVEYSASEPHALNDIMLTNNNVVPVHFGAAPLPQSYKGDNVIMGFVDSGIELNHPDFQNEDGSTRIIALWDQTQDETIPFRVPAYGYGQEWNAEDIAAGITNHDDQASFFGHGSTVVGSGAGNGNATGNFKGVAPNADIIMVSSDFNRPNWTASVAEAVDFIFAKADAVGKPAVVNLSLGDYFGSHDGLDAPSLFIDDLLDGMPGRAVVAAAGNSGNIGKYHLAYEIPEVDTAFTWFKYNPNTLLGEGAVFFEVWADTANFSNTSFTIGADLSVPNYEFRGYANWRTASENLDVGLLDTITYNGSILGIVETYCGLRGAQYLIQVKVSQPFSTQYLWRFATTGGGNFDCWSYAPFGTSAIVSTNLPEVGMFPAMQFYQLPDISKTMVDSWVCSDKVITVGNYVNRSSFPNYLGETTSYSVTAGEIALNCSRGPTRDMREKPDIAASGDNTLSAGRLATLNSFINLEPHKVAEDGMHYINGGTSMASPVVAGVAALYLQRDPDAEFLAIKNAITENAIADPFTGILPGDQFGYGKLNAFATLTQPFTTVGISSISRDGKLKIYPNPAKDYVQINASGIEIESFRIIDLSGRQLWLYNVKENGNEAYRIALPAMADGIYLIQAQLQNGEVALSKLIIGN